MSNENSGKDLLENAYRLQSPDDNIAYYDKLADVYDGEFADGLGYALPGAIAERYKQLGMDTDTPVADVGCGTGLLAEAIDSSELVIDGLDISDAMLKQAEQKKRYRHLHSVDLTQPLATSIKNYGAVLSSGTFTHGHLGPDAMVRLLDIAKGGALFILSINKEHFGRLGFEAAIGALVSEKQISDLRTSELNIYSVIGHEHSNDKGLIVSFRKN